MSENEGGDGKVGAFLLGFLVGVLVCLGAGGVFFVVATRQMSAQVEAVAAEEEATRAVLEVERAQLDAARRQAVEAERKARAAKPKEGN